MVPVGVEAVSGNIGESFRGTVHAAIDSGTSLVIMPESQGHRVAAAMFGSHLSSDCVWQISGELLCMCDIVSEVRPLSLEIGGVRFRMTGHEMFLHTGHIMENGQELCMTGLGLAPGIDIWILGDVFMRNVYVAHNFHERTISLFPRPGFAAEVTGLAAWIKAAPVNYGWVAWVTMLVLLSLAFSMACHLKARSRAMVANASMREPLMRVA